MPFIRDYAFIYINSIRSLNHQHNWPYKWEPHLALPYDCKTLGVNTPLHFYHHQQITLGGSSGMGSLDSDVDHRSAPC